jgi:ribonuclease VapC
VTAILFSEPSAPALLARLSDDPDRIMSVASHLETGTVLAGRRQSDELRAIRDLDRFLDEAGIGLAPVDTAQGLLALRARIQFGRGMGHGGVLNFGNLVRDALTKAQGEPPLFIGDDFRRTNVLVARQAVD